MQAAAPSARQGGASPQLILAARQQQVFKDRMGYVIPHTELYENCTKIDNLLERLKDVRKALNLIMKETEGDPAQAAMVSNVVIGSCFSAIWDQLADQKVVCSLVVVCPPAFNMAAMYGNEERVRWLIAQISGHMHMNIVEVWTSMQEIGTVSETFVYVRFPYHMWPKVEELGTKISQVTVGHHHFKAHLCREPNIKIDTQGWPVEPWEAQINGQNLPEVKKEDLAELQAAANTPCVENWRMSCR